MQTVWLRYKKVPLQANRWNSGSRFEGTGSIPIPDNGWDSDDPGPLEAVLTGEVGEQRLQRPLSNRTAVRFRIEVAV